VLLAHRINHLLHPTTPIAWWPVACGQSPCAQSACGRSPCGQTAPIGTRGATLGAAAPSALATARPRCSAAAAGAGTGTGAGWLTRNLWPFKMKWPVPRARRRSGDGQRASVTLPRPTARP